MKNPNLFPMGRGSDFFVWWRRWESNPYRIKLAKPAIAYEINGRFDPDEFDDGEFASFTQEEEARDRKIVFHCTKSELDAIMRFANVIDVKFVEEDIHHA